MRKTWKRKRNIYRKNKHEINTENYLMKNENKKRL